MKNKVNEALGLMKDTHIAEAANYRKNHWGWIPASAAVLALVIAGGALAHARQKPPVSLEQPSTNATVSVPQTARPSEQPTQAITPSGGSKLYWARSASNYNSMAKQGEIVIGENLEKAMELSTNPADYFAVSLEETTGVEKEVLYKKIILPIGAKEEYMQKGVLYLTRKQIENIKCPEGMAIVLKLYFMRNIPVICYGECMVSEDYFDKLIFETVDLYVSFKDVPYNDDCDEYMYTESCPFDAFMDEFLEEYGIAGTAWKYEWHRWGHDVLLMDVDVKAASKMLRDPRIDDMLDMYERKYPNPQDMDISWIIEFVYWVDEN